METPLGRAKERRREQRRPRARLRRRRRKGRWRTRSLLLLLLSGRLQRPLAWREAIRWHPAVAPLSAGAFAHHTAHLRAGRRHRHEEAQTHLPRQTALSGWPAAAAAEREPERGRSIGGYVERERRAERLRHEGRVVFCVHAAHVGRVSRVRGHCKLGWEVFMRFEHGRELCYDVEPLDETPPTPV